MYVKVCGITNLDQAQAIANLGVNALGFICVPQSQRYINPKQLRAITYSLPSTVEQIGVFVNANLSAIAELWQDCQLSGVQLHGQETPEFCCQLRQRLPTAKLIKAITVKSAADLALALSYSPFVDVLLFDAYHPQLAGGTGKTIDWDILQQWHSSPTAWWLAGGLHPGNVAQAITLLKPQGVDVSSGVERKPGDKDLDKVKQFLTALRSLT